MPKIVSVNLNGVGLTTTGSADIEIERHKAISDLLHENSFRLIRPETASGPYRLLLSLSQDDLEMQAFCTASGHEEIIRLGLFPLRGHIKDYVIICDNFYKTAKSGHFHKLEALDAGRRGLHDEAALLLAELLENKVILDKSTARRLFSLLYVLHMRNAPTF